MAETYAPYLSLEVVWDDEHMCEVQFRLMLGEWSGIARAYTTPDQMQRFSKELRWCGTAVGWTAEWVLGDDFGIRFYCIDRSGHIACQIRLAMNNRRNTNDRPEVVWKLSAEMRVDP